MLLPIPHHPFLLIALFSLLSLLMRVAPVLSSSGPIPPEPPPEDSPRICPLPKCKRCPTAEQILAPGVGFALEMGYGTAAIRLHDGKYQTITRIDGTPSYALLLRRLATGPQNRIPDHIPSTWGKLRYLQKRAQRVLNKSLGWPATPETAVLADLISMLKVETAAALGNGQQVTRAVLSSPDRIKLAGEEITDVFDYLGIRNLMAEPDTLEDLYATSSAYAGFGMGLCERYTDPYACEREESHFPTQWLLHLDFAPDNLSGVIMGLNSVKGGSVKEAFIDLELGLGRLDGPNKKPGLEPEVYWAAVTDRIRTPAQSFSLQITQLILTGSSASDPRFKAAVKDALGGLVAEGTLKALDEEGKDSKEKKNKNLDLVFATAKGAAEFAKRRQEGPVRCVEREECKRARERLGQEETEAREL
ncbi:hypothetical protein FGG08_004596 [Glutinoglossum americanum]|uniref:Uncharacterized protein n=1 Tax=Glutinoglossum americanum TaxID=1670608 RepID=A0A9P8I5C2_9PEZI|nr:hypothetical protein FGG08_004596 [Glutinoglossum americanum]